MSQDATTPEIARYPYYEIHEDGTARLGDLDKLDFNDSRLLAYEECEAVNAAVGSSLALAGNLPNDIITMLGSIQHDLFDLTTDLGTPSDAADRQIQLTERHLIRLDRALEHYGSDYRPVNGFLLPGGTVSSALMSQARTICLRAERACWSAAREHPDTLGNLPALYLHRLALLLSALARAANAEHGDTVWRPMASVLDTPTDNA